MPLRDICISIDDKTVDVPFEDLFSSAITRQNESLLIAILSPLERVQRLTAIYWLLDEPGALKWVTATPSCLETILSFISPVERLYAMTLRGDEHARCALEYIVHQPASIEVLFKLLFEPNQQEAANLLMKVYSHFVGKVKYEASHAESLRIILSRIDKQAGLFDCETDSEMLYPIISNASDLVVLFNALGKGQEIDFAKRLLNYLIKRPGGLEEMCSDSLSLLLSKIPKEDLFSFLEAYDNPFKFISRVVDKHEPLAWVLSTYAKETKAVLIKNESKEKRQAIWASLPNTSALLMILALFPEETHPRLVQQILRPDNAFEFASKLKLNADSLRIILDLYPEEKRLKVFLSDEVSSEVPTRWGLLHVLSKKTIRGVSIDKGHANRIACLDVLLQSMPLQGLTHKEVVRELMGWHKNPELKTFIDDLYISLLDAHMKTLASQNGKHRLKFLGFGNYDAEIAAARALKAYIENPKELIDPSHLVAIKSGKLGEITKAYAKIRSHEHRVDISLDAFILKASPTLGRSQRARYRQSLGGVVPFSSPYLRGTQLRPVSVIRSTHFRHAYPFSAS